MPGVKNKKRYVVYLTESEVEFLKSLVEYETPGSGGFSALIDDHVCKLAATMRATGLKPGQKISWSKIVKMFLKGIIQ